MFSEEVSLLRLSFRALIVILAVGLAYAASITYLLVCAAFGAPPPLAPTFLASTACFCGLAIAPWLAKRHIALRILASVGLAAGLLVTACLALLWAHELPAGPAALFMGFFVLGFVAHLASLRTAWARPA